MPTYAVVNGENPGPLQHPAVTLVGPDGAPWDASENIPSGTYGTTPDGSPAVALVTGGPAQTVTKPVNHDDEVQFKAGPLVDVRRFGVVGSGLVGDAAADTAGLIAAAAACYDTDKVLYGAPGLTIRLNATVDLRRVRNIVMLSTISIDHATDPGITIGGNAADGTNVVDQHFRYVKAQSGQTQPLIKVVGVKRGNIRIDNCGYLQLAVDGNIAAENGIFYSKFFLGVITKLELVSANGSGVNENAFYGARVVTMLMNGTYNHNGNMFHGFSMEAGTITVDAGINNSWYDLRDDQGLTITCAAGTYKNTFYPKSALLRGVRTPIATITDNGFENRFVTPWDTSRTGRTLARVDAQTRLFTSAAEIAMTAYPVPTLGNKLASPGGFAAVIDTGIFPVDVAGDYSTAASLRRLFLNSDITGWRVDIFVYDVDKVPFTGANIYVDGASYTDQGGYYGLSADSIRRPIAIYNTAVKFARIRVRCGSSNTTGTLFEFVEVVAMVDAPKADQIVDRVRRQMRRPLRQTASPTKGVGHLGESVAHATGSYIVVARTDTALTAAAVATDLTITVGSISGMVTGDIIGVELDTGGTHWTTINGAPAGSTVTLAVAMPSGAAIGRAVVTNRWLSVT